MFFCLNNYIKKGVTMAQFMYDILDRIDYYSSDHIDVMPLLNTDSWSESSNDGCMRVL